MLEESYLFYYCVYFCLSSVYYCCLSFSNCRMCFCRFRCDNNGKTAKTAVVGAAIIAWQHRMSHTCTLLSADRPASKFVKVDSTKLQCSQNLAVTIK